MTWMAMGLPEAPSASASRALRVEEGRDIGRKG